MKTLLSLFDYSGQWSAPFAANGWNVIQWDIKLAEFMDVNNIDSAEYALENFENVDGVIAAPPCTEFTACCAQYWKIKDEDGRTAKALELVRQVQRIANLFTPTDPDFAEEGGTFFWAMENPVGRLKTLAPELGAPYYFNPCDFAGHLNPSKKVLKELARIRAKDGINVTRDEFEYCRTWNAYTKKTGLWGDFNRAIELKPIEPVKVCAQGGMTQRFGGKSDATKEERSMTPAGFAWAFYEANKNHVGAWATQSEFINY